MNFKQLLHPVACVRVARQRLRRDAELRRVVRLGRQRFSGDPRYRIESVGSFGRSDVNLADDTRLLRRICSAYNKAAQDQARAADGAFEASRWWKVVQQGNLGPVMQALADSDVHSLDLMYRNFFRDRCGAGLTAFPIDLVQGGARTALRTIHKEFALIDALHRVDTWKSRTNGKCNLSALCSPDIGNPFGVWIDGAFVRTRSEDQHFYAQNIGRLLRSADFPVVAEIGGGFGGMAYYLIRDHPGVTYVNFDVPESIALASYYLAKAFPHLKTTLYGEAALDAGALRTSDIILMPCCEVSRLPEASVDVWFNSHVFSDLTNQAVQDYLAVMTRSSRGHILHVNELNACTAVSEYMARHATNFVLAQEREATWNSARSERSKEFESLYSRRDPSLKPVI